MNGALTEGDILQIAEVGVNSLTLLFASAAVPVAIRLLFASTAEPSRKWPL